MGTQRQIQVICCSLVIILQCNVVFPDDALQVDHHLSTDGSDDYELLSKKNSAVNKTFNLAEDTKQEGQYVLDNSLGVPKKTNDEPNDEMNQSVLPKTPARRTKAKWEPLLDKNIFFRDNYRNSTYTRNTTEPTSNVYKSPNASDHFSRKNMEYNGVLIPFIQHNSSDEELTLSNNTEEGLWELDLLSIPRFENTTNQQTTSTLLNISTSNTESKNMLKDLSSLFLVHNAVVTISNETNNETLERLETGDSIVGKPKSENASNSNPMSNDNTVDMSDISIAAVTTLLAMPNSTRVVVQEADDTHPTAYVAVTRTSYTNLPNGLGSSVEKIFASSYRNDTNSNMTHHGITFKNAIETILNLKPDIDTSALIASLSPNASINSSRIIQNNGESIQSNESSDQHFLTTIFDDSLDPWASHFTPQIINSLDDILASTIKVNPNFLGNIARKQPVKRDTSNSSAPFNVTLGENSDPHQNEVNSTIGVTTSPENVNLGLPLSSSSKVDNKAVLGISPEEISEIIRNATITALSSLNITNLNTNRDISEKSTEDTEKSIENDSSRLQDPELVESFTAFIKLLTAATLAAVLQPTDFL